MISSYFFFFFINQGSNLNMRYGSLDKTRPKRSWILFPFSLSSSFLLLSPLLFLTSCMACRQGKTRNYVGIGLKYLTRQLDFIFFRLLILYSYWKPNYFDLCLLSKSVFHICEFFALV